ncbi:hypothetical protein Tco_0552646, partial [Tanacetum coccineum]
INPGNPLTSEPVNSQQVPFGEEEEIRVLVKKEDVKMAVECLMDKADKEGVGL